MNFDIVRVLYVHLARNELGEVRTREVAEYYLRRAGHTPKCPLIVRVHNACGRSIAFMLVNNAVVEVSLASADFHEKLSRSRICNLGTIRR